MIRVSSLNNASELARGWANQVVSLLDPHIPSHLIPNPAMFGINSANWICQFMADYDDSRGPSLELVSSILSRVSHSSRVLVHCHGGISRSPAIAIGILVSRGMNPDEAINSVLNQNLVDNEGSMTQPNELIIHHIDRLYELNGTLLDRLHSHM